MIVKATTGRNIEDTIVSVGFEVAGRFAFLCRVHGEVTTRDALIELRYLLMYLRHAGVVVDDTALDGL